MDFPSPNGSPEWSSFVAYIYRYDLSYLEIGGNPWVQGGSTRLRGPIFVDATYRLAGYTDLYSAAAVWYGLSDDVDPSKAVACPLPIGSATAHHPLTLHYTGANQTDDYRRVWILHFGAYGRARFHLHPKMIAARVAGFIRSL